MRAGAESRGTVWSRREEESRVWRRHRTEARDGHSFAFLRHHVASLSHACHVCPGAELLGIAYSSLNTESIGDEHCGADQRRLEIALRPKLPRAGRTRKRSQSAPTCGLRSSTRASSIGGPFWVMSKARGECSMFGNARHPEVVL
jgi:hypothetical protein